MAIDAAVELVLVTDPSTLAYYAASGGALVDLAAVADTNEAADLIFAGILAVASASIQLQYVNLAEGYRNIYRGQRDFYYTYFQNNVNGELGLNNQVFAIPPYSPDYDGQALQVGNFQFLGAFSGSDQWWFNHASMYNDVAFNQSNNAYGGTGLNGAPEDLDNAATTSDFDTYLYRYEEHRKDVYDERTWEWQNQSLNFGVKQASVVESGLATSFPFLDQATNNMADFFATQSNGLARYGGYRHSLASEGAKLAAFSQRGTALAMSTNLGVDRRSRTDDSMQTFGLGNSSPTGYYKPNQGQTPGLFENAP